MNATLDNLWSSIKQNAEQIRLTIHEIGSTRLPNLFAYTETSSLPEKGLPILDFSFNKSHLNEAELSLFNRSVSNTKHFFIQNKREILQAISKLVGITTSAVVSYYLFKWILNSMDPTKKEKELAKNKAEKLLREIGILNLDLNEYELFIASNIISPQDIDVTWDDIGGLDDLIADLRETVIYPLKNNTLKKSRSRLIKAPTGVLLFGPPGNAKTMIAKALAKESGARFINLQVSTLLDKWYGESQKRTDAIFSLAKKIQPVIIFIDEIDSFMRSRNSVDHECTLMMKTQFMTLWDGLGTNESNRILIIGATNRPQDVDPAILRRMPALFNIKLPDYLQRIKILKIILKNEDLSDDVCIDNVAEQTKNYSGSDLKELCRCAAMNAFVRDMKNEQEQLKEDTEVPQTKICKIDFDVAFEKLSIKRLTVNENHNFFNFE